MFKTLRAVKDIAIGLSPWVPWDKDFGLDSITAQDLTAAIAADVPDAHVVNFEMDRDRGTTDRARLTLEWNDAGIQAGLPTAAFAKGTPSMAQSRVLNSTFGLCATEVSFYNNAYHDLAGITLKPYYAKVAPGGRFLLVLESKDENTHFYTPDGEASLQHAEAIVDALATMHGRFYKSPRFATDLSWVTPYRGRPGQVLAHRVLLLAEKRGS